MASPLSGGLVIRRTRSHNVFCVPARLTPSLVERKNMGCENQKTGRGLSNAVFASLRSLRPVSEDLWVCVYRTPFFFPFASHALFFFRMRKRQTGRKNRRAKTKSKRDGRKTRSPTR